MIDDTSELLEQFNTHFSKIADKLREKLPDLNIDLSRLTNLVNSRKDRDVVFTLRVLLLLKLLVLLLVISINLLVLTGLMQVYFVWLHQLSRRVLQG